MNESKTITVSDLVDTFVEYIEAFGSCPIRLHELNKTGYSFEEIQTKLQEAIATSTPLNKDLL